MREKGKSEQKQSKKEKIHRSSNNTKKKCSQKSRKKRKEKKGCGGPGVDSCTWCRMLTLPHPWRAPLCHVTHPQPPNPNETDTIASKNAAGNLDHKHSIPPAPLHADNTKSSDLHLMRGGAHLSPPLAREKHMLHLQADSQPLKPHAGKKRKRGVCGGWRVEG